MGKKHTTKQRNKQTNKETKKTQGGFVKLSTSFCTLEKPSHVMAKGPAWKIK